MTNWLLHHLLEGTLFCGLLGSATCCLTRCAAKVRYTVWLIGLSKFALPTVLLAAGGAWMAALLPARDWVLALASRFLALFEHLIGTWSFRIDAGPAVIGSFLVVSIWALGSMVMFGVWLYHLRNSYKSLPAASSESRALKLAKQRLGFGGSIELQITDRTTEPRLVGIFSPVILLPQGLSTELSPAELQAVLQHEIAHARRRDNLIGAFVHCLVCLFWFHPLLWFVERRLIAERERACDELVLDTGTTKSIYLDSLTKVCSYHLFGNVAGTSAASGSDLKTRFAHIDSYRASHPVPYMIRLALPILALFVTILPVAGGYCEQCVSNGQTQPSTYGEITK